jgi:GxxExxY protein
LNIFPKRSFGVFSDFVAIKKFNKGTKSPRITGVFIILYSILYIVFLFSIIMEILNEIPGHQANNYLPVPEYVEELARQVIDAAFKVHNNLGPGLLEKVYEACFCYELQKKGLNFRRQVDIPITYDNLVFNEGLRLDVIVEDSIICELKALETVNPVWKAQLLSHLKLTGVRLGFLINFNVTRIKDGITRIIL